MRLLSAVQMQSNHSISKIDTSFSIKVIRKALTHSQSRSWLLQQRDLVLHIKKKCQQDFIGTHIQLPVSEAYNAARQPYLEYGQPRILVVNLI